MMPSGSSGGPRRWLMGWSTTRFRPVIRASTDGGRVALRKGYFIDLVAQVKGGHTGPGDVQAFNGARQQAKADLGFFTCFEESG